MRRTESSGDVTEFDKKAIDYGFLAKSVGLFGALCFCFALLAGVIHYGTAVRRASGSTLPLFVDTDMSPTDTLALTYLFRRADVDIRVISVAGNAFTHAAMGAQNALNLAQLHGRGHSVRVGAGALYAKDENFTGGCRYQWVIPEWLRSTNDALFGYATKLPRNPEKRVYALPLPLNPSPQTLNAAQYVDFERKMTIELGRFTAPRSVRLLCLTTLTNYAHYFKRNPTDAEKVAELIVVGGAMDERGNIMQAANNKDAELHFFLDPHAADYILSGTNINVTLIPLDVTNKLAVKTTLAALSASLTTPTPDRVWLRGMITGLLDFYDTKTSTLGSDTFNLLHPDDIIGALYATDMDIRSSAILEQKRLRVNTTGGRVEESTGRVYEVAAGSVEDGKSPKLVTVVKGLDLGRLWDRYTKVLRVGLPRTTR